MAQFDLRPVQPEDENFLLAVYASTREEELTQVPWDAAQREAFIRFQFVSQLNHYQGNYPDAEHQIIIVDGRPVGRLYVDRREDEIRILDIALLTEDRGRKIGSRLLRQLMDEARETGKPLTIHLDFLSRSRRLFERLGFKVVADDGLYALFEWRHET